MENNTGKTPLWHMVLAGAAGSLLTLAALGAIVYSVSDVEDSGGVMTRAGTIRYVVYRDQLVPVASSVPSENPTLGDVLDAVETAVSFSTNGVSQ